MRKNCEGFEVIAGQRRLRACEARTKEQEIDPLPCAIMEDKDDAKAVEASLAENIARLPMDEIDQYEAFLSLSKSGKTVEDIADHFGVTTRLVKQRLAIANLYDPILNAYRREEIEPSIIRLLTMASVRQQKEWFELFKQDEEPPHWQWKNWLFGGDEIPTDNALFDLEAYKGVITSDLFGESSYFADSKAFWEEQSKAVASLIEDYQDEGWPEVILLNVGDQFLSWDYVDTDKEDGGKVYIHAARDGTVTPYEGQLSRADMKRREKARRIEGGDEPEADRPELTQSMLNYLDLHGHASVRAELLQHEGIPLRLAVALLVAGSTLITAHADPQKTNTDKIRESLKANTAEDLFAQERLKIRSLLDLADDDGETIVPQKQDWGISRDLHAIFDKLLTLDNQSVTRILTFVKAETLPAGTSIVELLGDHLTVKVADYWKPGDVFFDLIKDKEAINAMLAEIGGKSVAQGNLTATAKVQKEIIQDCIDGQNGRNATPDWQPRYMAFPMKGYTNRQNTITAVAVGKALRPKTKAA